MKAFKFTREQIMNENDWCSKGKNVALDMINNGKDKLTKKNFAEFCKEFEKVIIPKSHARPVQVLYRICLSIDHNLATKMVRFCQWDVDDFNTVWSKFIKFRKELGI